MNPTQELIAACLRNQASAQKQLYEAYAPQMLGVCYRYARDKEEARDMMQEGFVKVFRNLHQWKGDGELGAWIRRIMINAALNWLRDHRRIKWENESAIPEHFEANAVPTPINHLDARQLADMIRQLPPGYQAIFNLHAVEGYPHVDIARMLGINEATSRSQYLRARRLLMERIQLLDPDKKNAHVGRA